MTDTQTIDQAKIEPARGGGGQGSPEAGFGTRTGRTLNQAGVSAKGGELTSEMGESQISKNRI